MKKKTLLLVVLSVITLSVGMLAIANSTGIISITSFFGDRTNTTPISQQAITHTTSTLQATQKTTTPTAVSSGDLNSAENSLNTDNIDSLGNDLQANDLDAQSF